VASRPLDITLFGVTGYTGQLSTKYLSEHMEAEGIRWAIAGRNLAKLSLLQNNLPKSADEIIIADTTDPQSLSKMITQAAILMNAASPFNLYVELV